MSNGSKSFIENVNIVANATQVFTSDIIEDAENLKDDAARSAKEARESAGESLSSAELAKEWATKGVNLPVEPNQFSAYHWSVVSKENAKKNVLNDLLVSNVQTWSSQKIADELSQKSGGSHIHTAGEIRFDSSNSNIIKKGANVQMATDELGEYVENLETEIYNNFANRYLGSQPTDPTVDNHGKPLVSGALYFNNQDLAMRVYNGSTWELVYAQGNANLSGLLRDVYEEVTTAPKTTFAFPYHLGTEVVVLNGVVLAPDDYTALDEQTIILNSPTEVDDYIFITAYAHASVKGVYTKNETDRILFELLGKYPAFDDVDMDDHGIQNLASPRAGVVGEKDAVNRIYVDQKQNKLFTTTTDAVEAQITVAGAADKFAAVKILGDMFRGTELIDGDTIVVEKTATSANDVHEGIFFYDKDTDKWYFAGTGTGDAGPTLPVNHLRDDHLSSRTNRCNGSRY